MMGGNLERCLPPKWAGSYEPLALLKDGEQRQTLLVRERGGKPGRLAVMKREAGDGRHLQSEYDLLTALAGPGVPVVYAHLNSGGASFLLREYVEGETLLEYMQKHPKLSAREAAAIGIEICRVLRRLHEQNPPVVHRDIKAENIIRRRDGTCALIDFGIARRTRDTARRDTELLGTPDVAPPEQFGLRQTEPSADVYAMGVLLRELTTGERAPDRGRDPAPLRRVIRRCTAIDPSKRYRDAGELERALRKVGARRALPLAACACLVAALLTIWALRPARVASPSESEIYTFASPAIEAEVCRQLGLEAGSVTRGDLASVERILLVGEMPFRDWESLRVFGEEVWLDGSEVHSDGDVDTLADIPNFPNLRDLALCRQRIDDLSPLANCAQLQRLALCGNEIGDLAPLSACSQLQEVFLSDNPIEDLSPLRACGEIWKLNFGATRVTSLDALTGMPNLIYVESHDAPLLEDITALEQIAGLWHLSLRPIRPGFLEVIGRLTRLENLYIWQPDGDLADLTPLSRLTNLRRLFVHAAHLGSLRGLEAMARLDYLEVYGDAPLDLRPLTSLEALTEFDAAHLCAQDWTPLTSMRRLERVICTPAQAAEIRRQLGDRNLRASLVTDG